MPRLVPCKLDKPKVFIVIELSMQSGKKICLLSKKTTPKCRIIPQKIFTFFYLFSVSRSLYYTYITAGKNDIRFGILNIIEAFFRSLSQRSFASKRRNRQTETIRNSNVETRNTFNLISSWISLRREAHLFRSRCCIQISPRSLPWACPGGRNDRL